MPKLPDRKSAAPERVTRKKQPVAAAQPGRRYHHGDLRNALVAAALEQIEAVGGRAMSLREVARAAGVTHASVYRHFPSKESLLAVVAEQGFHMLSAALRHASDSGSNDPAQRLAASGEAYVDFAVTHPAHLQAMFGGLVPARSAHPSLKQAADEAYGVLEANVRACHAAMAQQGAQPGEAGPASAIGAWALVHGLALLIANGEIASDTGQPVDHRALAASILRPRSPGGDEPPRPEYRPRNAPGTELKRK